MSRRFRTWPGGSFRPLSCPLAQPVRTSPRMSAPEAFPRTVPPPSNGRRGRRARALRVARARPLRPSGGVEGTEVVVDAAVEVAGGLVLEFLVLALVAGLAVDVLVEDGVLVGPGAGGVADVVPVGELHAAEVLHVVLEAPARAVLALVLVEAGRGVRGGGGGHRRDGHATAER